MRCNDKVFYIASICLSALVFVLAAFPSQASTVYKAEEIFVPPNPNGVVRRGTFNGLQKIGPQHAVFFAQTGQASGELNERSIHDLHVFDARSRTVTKVASFESPGDTSVSVTRVSSREVWVDVMGHLYLANSLTGSVTLVKDFGVEFGGSLGPWQSCLGFGEEIFIINNFSYIQISDFCDIEPGQSRHFVFDHSSRTLSPIAYDFLKNSDSHWVSRLIIDNSRKEDNSAIGLYHTFKETSSGTLQVLQLWEIDPVSRTFRLISEEKETFNYSRFRMSAKTSKGVYICSPEKVLRIANNLNVDVISESRSVGCDRIKEYRDYVIWEASELRERNKLFISDGTLSPITFIGGSSNDRFINMECETWGKLFYSRSSISPPARSPSINYVDENLGQVEIPFDRLSNISTCLNNKLVVRSGSSASIYDLRTNTNTRIREDGLTEIVELGNGLFTLKYKRIISDNDIEENIDFSLQELVTFELQDLSPSLYLLLLE